MQNLIEISHEGSQWYVVHCKPMREWQAAGLLEHLLRLTAYVPEVRSRVGREFRYTPFFPGYLFVLADLQQVNLSNINAIPGVLRLVSFGDMPMPIPEPLIGVLRQKLDSLNAAGGLPAHNFEPGDIARLRYGPLEGLEAVFLGSLKASYRVQVLIDFLGSQRKMDVDVNMLDRPSSTPAFKRKRRTRGKGRPVNRL